MSKFNLSKLKKLKDYKNLEKWTLALLVWITGLTANGTYIYSVITNPANAHVDATIVTLVGLFVTGLVARKYTSYNKPSTYDNNVGTQVTPELNTEISGNSEGVNI